MTGWGGLVAAVEAYTEGAETWERAELHLLEGAFRARLAEIGVRPTAEAAVTLMAAAVLVAEHAPEWGGDARDVLAELAQLGLRLLSGGDGG